MQLQSSSGQRGVAADIRQRDDNASRRLLSPHDRRFLNQVIHHKSLEHQPDNGERLISLATKLGASPDPLRRRESSQEKDGDGFSFAFAAFGALGALSTGAYYAYQERAREREEQERQRKERERQQEARQFRITIAVVVLGVFGLWYSGWFFVVFGLVLVALLMACACSS
ncbi:Aste57867_9975 [Aphanomyces stellatus]|uniref:Aste57867_9975 protein n=1 Tax=Aphanomyces stellatus TaxID=120398 RepID=A0A485KPV4_9STRA|nr:hypothetical protein As57867_009936 [Aphanomyces stellatus]VFT86853.1 Aste57867_9975 [Aphanomyces stellatus]